MLKTASVLIFLLCSTSNASREIYVDFPTPQHFANADSDSFNIYCMITNHSLVAQNITVTPKAIPFASLNTDSRGVETLTQSTVTEAANLNPNSSLKLCWGRAATYDHSNVSATDCRYLFVRGFKVKVDEDDGYLKGSCQINKISSATYGPYLPYSFDINGGKPF